MITSRPFIDWKTQLIPARGRKPGARSRRPDALDTTYPREGTETGVQPVEGAPCDGHNLSPRGDGNQAGAVLEHSVGDTTYPREGTETCGLGSSASSARTQLIPARGRKPLAGSSFQPRAWDTTYPREGTETPAGRRFCLRRSDTTYPREGTETLIPWIKSKTTDGHNLSPRGDGNDLQQRQRRRAHDTTYPREGTETTVVIMQ